jgi:alpha-ketoglutarate-dependent taurine dioxygenase
MDVRAVGGNPASIPGSRMNRREILVGTTTLPRIHPLTPTIGAVISDADLSGPLDPEAIRAIREALLEYGVIFFKDQNITRDQLKSFAASFGELGRTFKSPDAAADEVGEMVITAPKGTTDIWHADSTYMESPPLGAVLRAVRLPPLGGDTCWASMYAAYEALSEPMRKMLDGLTAVHSVFPVVQRLGLSLDDYLRQSGSEPTESVHPVVRVHPETGRKLLFVNQSWTTRIVELNPAESSRILELLFEHVKSPDFNIRHRWAPNDVAFWDNRAVLHYAVPDYHVERVMQRIVIAGDRPVGPSS